MFGGRLPDASSVHWHRIEYQCGRECQKTVCLLGQQVRIVKISTVSCRETEERPEQPPCYHCVGEIEKDTPPRELKHGLLRCVEEQSGRRRSEDKCALRTIDLALVLYDDLNVKAEDRTLPDPEILHRPFLAIPLRELTPELTLAGFGMSLEEIAAALPDKKMIELDRYPELLRRAVHHASNRRED